MTLKPQLATELASSPMSTICCNKGSTKMPRITQDQNAIRPESIEWSSYYYHHYPQHHYSNLNRNHYHYQRISLNQ